MGGKESNKVGAEKLVEADRKGRGDERRRGGVEKDEEQNGGCEKEGREG